MKIMVIGVILLFVGMTFAPTVAVRVVTASLDTDYVEVSTETCGIPGYRNTTVRLTNLQYHALEDYLTEFKTRLDQATTREEAVPIFIDAVAELHKYNLLPKGMSLLGAQSLITRNGLWTPLWEKQTSPSNSSGLSNQLCLIAGQATNCFVSNPLTPVLQDFVLFLDQLFPYFIYLHQVLFLFMLGILIGPYCLNIMPLMSRLTSLRGFALLAFGYYSFYGDTDAAKGWINTVGLQGLNEYTGEFYGQIPYPKGNPIVRLYTGAVGFTGIRLYLPDQSSHFMGTAVAVNIGDTPP
jgi:hypothetical protein